MSKQIPKIPLKELRFVYGTSTGPGGQHVNRTATKATLLFDINQSLFLSQSHKNKLFASLSTRINKEGILRVSSSKHRSQKANREETITRFFELINDVLKSKKIRKKTSIPSSSRRKRLEQKKKRGDKKRLRGQVQPEEH
ncbi:MAG: alternative ribosome rescue aminoacyl-tRNA hydrolase ArfB [Phycisphaerales bacterium]|jgi:ribosome-associated protein|nr:alternative ribosome rescue aminoacyl-tRNA hydrolase ArfB [Phycisphaerales bacterium]